MTDSDIIKALECCISEGECAACPMRGLKTIGCVERLIVSALDLIKRKQVEIERLKAENAELEAEAEKQYEQARADILGNMADGGASCHWCIAEHKKNAIKDFTERLKAKAYKPCDRWPTLYVVDVKDIDALVAEMEGENGRA